MLLTYIKTTTLLFNISTVTTGDQREKRGNDSKHLAIGGDNPSTSTPSVSFIMSWIFMPKGTSNTLRT
jgi:hypothetical protein